MKMRKIIAVISAVAMLLSGAVTVSANTNVQGKYYNIPFDLSSSADFTPGEYPVAGTDVKWVYENNVAPDGEHKGKAGRAKITTTNAATGERALYMFAQNGGATVYNPGAKMTLHLGKKSGNGTYTVQFDMMPWDPDYRDFIAMNMAGWDSTARLSESHGGKTWTRGAAFQGSKHGDNRDFYTYTGTLTTENDPELSFAPWGYSRMTIDNIIVKDSTGKVIFSEDFEGGIPEIPEEPEVPEIDPSVPKHTYLHGNYYESPFDLASTADFTPGNFQIGDTKAKWVYENYTGNGKTGRAKITTGNVVTGERALYLFANNGGDGALYNPGAKMTIHLGKKTGNGTYTVQFDMAPWDADYRDFIAMNMAGWETTARLSASHGGTTWTQGAEVTPVKNGDNKKYYTYTGTVTTENDPELSFAVWGYSRMVIDNIIIKDSTGTIVFSEGFEGGIPEGWVPPTEPDEPEVPEFDPSVPEHTYLHGNYYESPFDLASTADFTPGNFQIGDTKAKWVYENHTGNGKTGRAKITTGNVVSGARSLYIYAQNGGNGALYNPGAKMTIHLGKKTGDGTYTVQFDMGPWDADYRDFIAMNMAGWETTARLSAAHGGTTWTQGAEVTPVKNGDNLKYYTYTGTVKTENDPELSFAVWGYSRMVIDNIIIKDSTGTIVFSEGFEGGIPEGWVPPADPDEPEVPSIIYDAEIEVVEKVGNDYEVVETATRLKAGDLLKASVKIENFTETDPVSANVFTALYRDNYLVEFDQQTVSAVTGGEMSSGAIFKIPALNDGVYTLKVFVWDNGFNPLKDVKSLGE